MAKPVPVFDLANGLTGLIISATNDEAANIVSGGNANLFKLPNELLHQIIGYLTTADEINAADGFGSATDGTYNGMTIDLARRQARAGHIQTLLDVALTCNRLAPVAKEALFASVSPPQPQQPPAADSRYHSPLTRFPHTAVKLPDMASKTKDLAV